jgi:hypothetical protein
MKAARQRRFNGRATYNAARDHDRLSRQYDHVFAVMRDGKPRTLASIRREAARRFHMRHSIASISARLRDMRKKRFGRHIVNRDYVGAGLWQYTVIVRKQRKARK